LAKGVEDSTFLKGSEISSTVFGPDRGGTQVRGKGEKKLKRNRDSLYRGIQKEERTPFTLSKRWRRRTENGRTFSELPGKRSLLVKKGKKPA